MDYLTAALHSKSFRPPRAPAAYLSDLFDLEARKSACLQSSSGGTADNSPGALAEGKKAGADRGMFYDVHGLIFDDVAPNMQEMIEEALGLPADAVDGSSTGASLKWLDILDLGCGQGRMGRQLDRLANYIMGVDLSEEAIKHAKRTRTYDFIKQGDVVTVLKVGRASCVSGRPVHRRTRLDTALCGTEKLETC